MNKIGLMAGVFDLFHVGHISALEEAKKVCDYLIVAIQIDPTIDRPHKNKPIQSIIERQLQVKGCRYVDETITYFTEAELEDLLSILPIDIRILGIDHMEKGMTGAEVCERRKIEIYYNERNHRFSTTELRERVKNG